MQKSVCRPLPLPPAMSPACRIEFTVNLSFRRGTNTPSILVELQHVQHVQHDSTVQDQSNILLSGLGWHEYTRDCCSSLRNTEIWVRCFLCVSNPSIENLRRFEHLRFRSHVLTQVTENTNKDIFRARGSLLTLSTAGMPFHFRLSIGMNSLERLIHQYARLFLLLRRI